MNLLEKTFQKDGCSIHYWLTPNQDAPWLIFLHGAGANHRMFKDQLKSLDEQFAVLLWDARGHGKSRPMGPNFSIKLLMDDILSIMDKEMINKATFIGQSMGGNVAQEIAFYYPEKVENLILIGCTWNMQKLTFTEKLTIGLTPLIMSVYPWDLMVKQSIRASSVKYEVQEYLRNAFLSIGSHDFTKIFLATANCLHTEEDYKINKPILLVCGEHDNTGNIKKIAPIWAKSEPQCEFHWIPDAGHCANQDNPEEFNKLMTFFLRNKLL
ncbi:alpha/beta fold hydrolase [Thermoflavimicrobium daqui]|jgi:pimeloyl-ACP methyl ester carboxylesterase|uniref:Alpha/beta hydrolase n=1 Tax=Thermoflavimicrobium daqui TaxID=2137476 RepID=A0A364K1T2_9BACL|nr:alpha/beta hydrolase [Thermoflavimicrobium daqui]RAL21984.1 alpha/beta hydrolase [Thermoflavimicrobium daqui]